MYKISSIEIKELQQQKNIIIYGASVGGRIVSKILDQYNCLYKICDRKKMGTTFCGVEVQKPEIIEANPDAIVLVVGTRSFDSQCAFLQSIGHKKYYNICELLPLYKKNYDGLTAFEKVAIDDYINKYKIFSSINDDTLILHTLDVIVTEKCSLRCRDCSALMPRYFKPIEYKVEEIIYNCKKLLQYVDYIIEMVIVGGEPLLHQNLYKLLEWGNNEEKIGAITIISNGTILPNENLCSNLVGTKSRLRLSDYGSLSLNKENILELAQRNGMKCFVQKLDEWQDMGKPEPRGYSLVEQKELFKDCPFSYSTFFLGSKLFRCGHAAHLFNLQLVKDKNDYVDIAGPTGNMKEIIKEYMDEKEFLGACNYCSGVGVDKKGIEQAIQCDGRKPIYEDE